MFRVFMGGLALGGAMAAVLFACARDDAANAPAPRARVAPAAARLRVAEQAHDLTSLVDRTFAFSNERDGLVARGSTHTIRVNAAGVAFEDPARGGVTLSSALMAGIAPRLDATGDALRTRANVTERVRQLPHGLEQSWRFDARPEGGGDFDLRMRAGGLPIRGVDDRGVLFGERGSELRLSHATWIDARGARTPIRVRRDGGELAILVPAKLLDASTYPAVLDPTLGAETAVDPTPVFVKSGAGAGGVSIGEGKDSYLVTYHVDLPERVLGVRVRKSDGALIGAPIDLGFRDRYGNRSVTFDGTAFMVSVEHGCGFSAARVVEATGVLAKRVTYVPLCGFDLRTQVFFQGTTAFVVGLESSAANDGPKVFPIDANLNLLASTALGPSGATLGNVALHAGILLLVYTVDDDAGSKRVFFQRYQASSFTKLGGPTEIPGAKISEAQPVLFDGTRFILVWNDVQGSKAARIDAATGALLSTLTVAGPDVATYVAATPDQLGVFARLSAGSWGLTRWSTALGTALDAVPIAMTGSLTGVIPSSARYTFINDSDLKQIDPATGVLTTLSSPAVVRYNLQRDVKIAFDGAAGLAAISDERGIYVARVDQVGAPVGSVATQVTDKNASLADVLFDGTDFVVVWFDSTVHARRVSKAGALVDATPVEVSAFPAAPVAIAASQGTTLFGGKNQLVRMKGGVVLDATPIALPTNDFVQTIVDDGASFVVFSDNSLTLPNCDHRATRVRASDGAVLDTKIFTQCASLKRASVSNGRIDVVGEGPATTWAAQLRGSDLSRLDAGPSVDVGAYPEFGMDDVSILASQISVDGTTASRVRRSDLSFVKGALPDGGVAPIVERLTGRPVATGNGRFVFSYSAYDTALVETRAFTRALTYAADGDTCVVDDDCASTRCTSGKCDAIPASASDAASDATTADASASDAAASDAASSEGGPVSDAASSEGGPVNDAAASEGGPVNEAGKPSPVERPNTTPSTDPAAPNPPNADDDGGCSIRPTSRANPDAAALLAALVAAAFVRRRRHAA